MILDIDNLICVRFRLFLITCLKVSDGQENFYFFCANFEQKSTPFWPLSLSLYNWGHVTHGTAVYELIWLFCTWAPAADPACWTEQARGFGLTIGILETVVVHHLILTSLNSLSRRLLLLSFGGVRPLIATDFSFE